jgi:hypothetical protein
MAFLTLLWYFYENNIYVISAIILRKLHDFYGHKYNTSELSTSLTVAHLTVNCGFFAHN